MQYANYCYASKKKSVTHRLRYARNLSDPCSNSNVVTKSNYWPCKGQEQRTCYKVTHAQRNIVMSLCDHSYNNY